jgi:ABC-2 type transport system permease protein
LLGAGMFGVGFNLVNMRERHLLRRLIVAPMGRFEFLAAFLGSRLLLVVPESLIVAAFGVLAFGVPFEGSLFLLLFAVLLGGIAFSGLGLLIAARPRTTEGVGGMMNLIMIPMWLLGGAFFSNERFPDWIQPVVQALPLTQMNEALRAILLTGDGIGAVALPLAYLAAFGVASMWLAVRIFRWT